MITDCYPTVLPWADPSILWIAENVRATWLTPFVRAVSYLGKMGPILFVLSLAYWFWNKQTAKYLIYGMFASFLINLWLKGIVMECRPPSTFWLDTIRDNSYSFPSGHAQVTILIWCGFAYYVRSKWLSVLFVTIGLMISLSRPYLGVHYLHDIAAGAWLGLVILGMAIFFQKKEIDLLRALPFWGKIFVLFGFYLLYMLCVNDSTGLTAIGVGASFGFWLGCQGEAKLLNYHPCPNYRIQLVQCLIGVGMIGLLWKGGDLWRHSLPPSMSLAVKYCQYALLGAWISFGAPKIFTLFPSSKS